MFENISASYDVGIAKKYGINCAVLLNKLIYLSKYTSRKDGYCWRTSKELEDELGLSRYQQDVAIKKLTEENIIETKNTYIIGTQIKCKHFKLLLDISKCDLQETNKSIDCRETNICDLQETNKSVNNNTSNNNTSKKENIKRKEYFENTNLNDLFYEFLEQRKKQKAVNSERAITLLLNKLNQFDDDTKKQMIEQSIENSWKGVFEIKQKKNKTIPKWFDKEQDISQSSKQEEEEMKSILEDLKNRRYLWK